MDNRDVNEGDLIVLEKPIPNLTPYKEELSVGSIFKVTTISLTGGGGEIVFAQTIHGYHIILSNKCRYFRGATGREELAFKIGT